MILINEECRLVFCVGVGGVGKTTFGAALGLREALAGRSVLVLTADPARRLADALGIDTLSDEPSRVSLPDGSAGALHAAMLETKASADAIIRRATDDQSRVKRVLDNKIYQAFSNTLARSHAYAAMERVHQAVHDPEYDLIIVDTPPAQSALEILDAPARLVRFLDQRVVRWFLRPSEDAPRLRGGALTKRLLAAIAGDSVVAALTSFLSEMAFLSEGFAERARDVRDRMRSADTEFILVTSADSMGVHAARSIAEEIERRGFALGCVAFNRGFIPVSARAKDRPPSYPAEFAELAPTLGRMTAWAREEVARRRAAVAEFQRERPQSVWVLPESIRPLGDITALSAWIRSALPAEALA